jgi:hypothetical protein
MPGFSNQPAIESQPAEHTPDQRPVEAQQ